MPEINNEMSVELWGKYKYVVMTNINTNSDEFEPAFYKICETLSQAKEAVRCQCEDWHKTDCEKLAIFKLVEIAQLKTTVSFKRPKNKK